jgi:hypothetical protein
VDYQTRSLALVNHCKALTEPHRINIFTAGLRDPLKTDVELEQPTTLEEAMALARAYEQRLAMPVDPLMWPGFRLAYGRAKQLALPAPTPVASGQTGTPAAAVTKPRFKRLTAAEMVAKRARDECYNCTKKFTKEHLEVCPIKGIFLLELDTPESTDLLEETTPQISLNAITGISAAETMKLCVQLSDDTIMALVDSGTTHSFISTDATYAPARRSTPKRMDSRRFPTR